MLSIFNMWTKEGRELKMGEERAGCLIVEGKMVPGFTWISYELHNIY